VAEALNRSGHGLGVRATHGEACTRPARARSRTRARVQLGHGAGSGMTSGPCLSATAGAGGETMGWRRRNGPAGPLAALGRGAAGLAGWARSLVGLKRGNG
jgi:hypothetical protein